MALKKMVATSLLRSSNDPIKNTVLEKDQDLFDASNHFYFSIMLKKKKSQFQLPGTGYLNV